MQFVEPVPLPVLDLIATGPSGTRRISVDLETGEVLPDAQALPLPGGDDVVRADLSGDGIPDLAVGDQRGVGRSGRLGRGALRTPLSGHDCVRRAR